MFGGHRNSASPTGAASIHKFIYDWKLPIFIQNGESKRSLNKEELLFMNDCFELTHQNIKFQDALYKLAGKYQGKIKNFDGKTIQTKVLDLEKYDSEIRIGLNKILAEIPISKIDPNKTISFVKSWIEKLGYGKELPTLMKKLQDGDMFNPLVEPIRWAGFFKHLIEGELDEIDDYIQYVTDELGRRKRANSRGVLDDEEFRKHTKVWEH